MTNADYKLYSIVRKCGSPDFWEVQTSINGIIIWLNFNSFPTWKQMFIATVKQYAKTIGRS